MKTLKSGTGGSAGGSEVLEEALSLDKRREGASMVSTSEETSEEEISPHDLRTWGRTKKTDSGDYV